MWYYKVIKIRRDQIILDLDCEEQDFELHFAFNLNGCVYEGPKGFFLGASTGLPPPVRMPTIPLDVPTYPPFYEGLGCLHTHWPVAVYRLHLSN